jgi:hypothetical protein
MYESKPCSICSAVPALWTVRTQYFCRLHRAEAYAAAAKESHSINRHHEAEFLNRKAQMQAGQFDDFA